MHCSTRGRFASHPYSANASSSSQLCKPAPPPPAATAASCTLATSPSAWQIKCLYRTCTTSAVQGTSGSHSSSSSSSSMQFEQWSLTQAGLARNPSQAHRPDIHVVLVEPQIPQNTGNAARTCAATNVSLHLVGPLGFEIDDKKLKRAGLDYWTNLCVQLHTDWDAFVSYFQSLPGPKRLVGYSVYGDQYYAAPEFQYRAGDWLLFGSETTGLPMKAHDDIRSSGGSLAKIPIVDTYVRSLNQSVTVGVGVFEAIRQLDIDRHVVQPREDTSNPMVRLPTPMMMAQQQQPAQQAHQPDAEQQQQTQQRAVV